MKISVVIPALDEADRIETAIQGALGSDPDPGGSARVSHFLAPASDQSLSDSQPAPSPGVERASCPAAGAARDLATGIEVVVVDGGSQDDTAARAAAAGARVFHGARGRAQQLEVGARECRGDVVLFLHADTRLAGGWAKAVRDALRDPSIIGGAFRFRFDDSSPVLRLVEWGARLRVALFQTPYGDQALFVRRRILEELGGVPQVPVMEDLDLVKAMKRHGRLAILPLDAVTSARRFRAQGPIRTLVRHRLAAGAWALGFDRERLAAWVHR